jgi:hypothetical protein
VFALCDLCQFVDMLIKRWFFTIIIVTVQFWENLRESFKKQCCIIIITIRCPESMCLNLHLSILLHNSPIHRGNYLWLFPNMIFFPIWRCNSPTQLRGIMRKNRTKSHNIKKIFCKRGPWRKENETCWGISLEIKIKTKPEEKNT